MAYCQNCGRKVPRSSNFCANCGGSLKTPQIQKSLSEKNCPKCGSQLEKGNLGYSGRTAAPPTILKKGDWIGDRIISFYCRNCGYIELYSEKFLTSP